MFPSTQQRLVGTTVGTMLSFGNSILSTNVLGPILGLVANGLFVFLPAFTEIDALFFYTRFEDNIYDQTMRWILILSGALLSVIQIQHLLVLLIPEGTMSRKAQLSALIHEGSVQAEFRIKQASVSKVNRMVRNAYDLHRHNEQSSERQKIQESLTASNKMKSSQDVALLNYTEISEETEEYGGFIWGWKTFLTGDLQAEEGVWLHSRLIAANAAQFLLCFVLIVLFARFAVIVDQHDYNAAESSSNHPLDILLSIAVGDDDVYYGEDYYNDACESHFNASDCVFDKFSSMALCPMDVLQDDECGDFLIPAQQSLDVCTAANAAFIAGFHQSNVTGFFEDECDGIVSRAKDIFSLNETDYLSEYLGCKAYDACKKNSISLQDTIDAGGDIETFYLQCYQYFSPTCAQVVNDVDSSLLLHNNDLSEQRLNVCTEQWGALIKLIETQINFCDGFTMHQVQQMMTVRAIEAASTSDYYCQSPMSFCFSGYMESLGNITFCLLSEFDGGSCNVTPGIKELIDYREANLPKVEMGDTVDWMPEKWV